MTSKRQGSKKQPPSGARSGTRIGAITLVAAGLLTSAVLAAGDGRDPRALTPRSLDKIHGSEVKKTTDKLLTEITWERDLEHALARAREEGKPVFWLQMVGNLDDGL